MDLRKTVLPGYQHIRRQMIRLPGHQSLKDRPLGAGLIGYPDGRYLLAGPTDPLMC
ncbi:MAG: hypothetical protein ACE144_17245 [Thermodesulfobacteriota bacterium]